MLIGNRISAMAGGGDIPPVPSVTVLEFTTTSTSGQGSLAGIYSATAIDPTVPIEVDWGDGNTSSVLGDISQLTHIYAEVGVHTATISDNISSLAMSPNSINGWTYTTYTLTGATLANSITSIPNGGFNGMRALRYFSAGESSNLLTFGESAFANIGIYGSAGNGNTIFDLSKRNVETLSKKMFYQSYYVKEVALPTTLRVLDDQAFYACGNYTSSLSPLVIPNGVTQIGSSCWEWAGGFSSISLPSTLTSIGGRAFYGASKTSTLIVDSMAAPTLGTNAFGSGSYYIGYEVAATETKTLRVPTGATGYTSGQWASPLCNSSQGGFTLVYV